MGEVKKNMGPLSTSKNVFKRLKMMSQDLRKSNLFLQKLNYPIQLRSKTGQSHNPNLYFCCSSKGLREYFFLLSFSLSFFFLSFQTLLSKRQKSLYKNKWKSAFKTNCSSLLFSINFSHFSHRENESGSVRRIDRAKLAIFGSTKL